MNLYNLNIKSACCY